MDILTELLDGPRARGAFLLRGVFEAPWSLDVRDEAPLTMISVRRGEVWMVPQGEKPSKLREGDTALLRGPAPYRVCDDPATTPSAVVRPGQICDKTEWHRGIREWGNSENGSTVLLIGTYRFTEDVTPQLTAVLPECLILPRAVWSSPLPTLLDTEVQRERPGQEVVLDRLLDCALIDALRSWCHQPGSQPPAWYRAAHDAVVGEALRLLYANIAHSWTVAELAEKVGISRAALARRFSALVGQPPMAFVTELRLTRAAELLRRSDITVESVARSVGYSSAFALSAAFTRERGISPSAHRRGSQKELSST